MLLKLNYYDKEEKIKYNMDLYYQTKQRCNYTSDPDEILRIWDKAQKLKNENKSSH